MGSVYPAESITVGGYPVPNIGYNLILFSAERRQATGPGVMKPDLGRVGFAQFRDGRLAAVLVVEANLGPSHIERWKDEPCRGDDHLWKNERNRHTYDVNCARVSTTGRLPSNTAFWVGLGQEAKRQQTVVPIRMLRASVTRLSSPGQRLSYSLYVNPVVSASNSQRTSRNQDALISEMITWATGVQSSMDNALAKKGDAFADVRAFKH